MGTPKVLNTILKRQWCIYTFKYPIVFPFTVLYFLYLCIYCTWLRTAWLKRNGKNRTTKFSSDYTKIKKESSFMCYSRNLGSWHFLRIYDCKYQYKSFIYKSCITTQRLSLTYYKRTHTITINHNIYKKVRNIMFHKMGKLIW